LSALRICAHSPSFLIDLKHRHFGVPNLQPGGPVGDECGRNVLKLELTGKRQEETGRGRTDPVSPKVSPEIRLVEIAELLGVTKQRAHQIAGEKGFPTPLAENARGRVWSRYQVQAWAKRWRREKPWR
jgi:hypothetical protein